MKHWSFIGIIACASILTTQGQERNILFVIADDLSPTIGSYGDPVAVTPNIDALAQDGALFSHAFATTASCSASRSVVLTGLHNHRNGHYGHLHSYHKFSSFDWVKSLPVLLQKAGYRTARAGKHHNGPEEVYYFETKIPGSSRSVVELANNCETFIGDDSEKPFFLYYATSDPHRGGGRATELPYQPNRFGNKPNRGAYPGVTEVFYDPDVLPIPSFLPDTPETRAELAQYYQSVSRVDQGLGRLIELLKKHDKWETTLVVFTSDHGMAFAGGKTTVYEGGLRVPFIARNPYAETRGHTNNAMVSFVDITPSLLDFAGIYDAENQAVKKSIATLPSRGSAERQLYTFHGQSFLPILDQVSPNGWDSIGASHTFHEIQMYYPMRVVRDRDYKLIWNIAHPLPYPFASDLWAAPSWQAQWEKGPDAPYGQKSVYQYIHRPEFEFFDIKNDPHESHNLANSPDYVDVLEQYKAKLKAFQTETEDPWIMKWEYE